MRTAITGKITEADASTAVDRAGLSSTIPMGRVYVTVGGQRAAYHAFGGADYHTGWVIALVPYDTDGTPVGDTVARSDVSTREYAYTHGGEWYRAACDRARAMLSTVRA